MIPRSSLGGSRLRVAWIRNRVIIHLRVLCLENVSGNLEAVRGALPTQISLKNEQLSIKIPDNDMIPGHQRLIHFIHHLDWRKARVLIVNGVWVLYFQIGERGLPDLERALGWPQCLLPGEASRGRWPPIKVSRLRPPCLIDPVDNLTEKSQ